MCRFMALRFTHGRAPHHLRRWQSPKRLDFFRTENTTHRHHRPETEAGIVDGPVQQVNGVRRHRWSAVTQFIVFLHPTVYRRCVGGVPFQQCMASAVFWGVFVRLFACLLHLSLVRSGISVLKDPCFTIRCGCWIWFFFRV